MIATSRPPFPLFLSHHLDHSSSAATVLGPQRIIQAGRRLSQGYLTARCRLTPARAEEASH